VPRVFSFSLTKLASDFGLRTAFVCWKRKLLFAEPPPLATKRKL